MVQPTFGTRFYTSNVPLSDLDTDISLVVINTEIGFIESLAEFGGGFENVGYQAVPDGRTYKLKGNYNKEVINFIVANDLSDVGQEVLSSEAFELDQNTYPFKLTFFGNSDAVYFGAKVISFKTQVGSVNNVFRALISLAINTNIVVGVNRTNLSIPDAKDLILSTFAPNISHLTSASLSPTRRNLVFSRFAPEIYRGFFISITRKDLILSTFVPNVTVGSTQHIKPIRKHLRFSTFRPSVVVNTTVVITPASSNLILSRSTPNPGKGVSRQVPRGNLIINQYTPNVVRSTNTKISPTRRNLQIDGFSPVVTGVETTRIVVSWAEMSGEYSQAFVSWTRLKFK